MASSFVIPSSALASFLQFFLFSNIPTQIQSAKLPLASLALHPITSSRSNCSLSFTMSKCEPLTTFRYCQNRECVCPTNLTKAYLPSNMSIDTFWDPARRQCTTKLGSACFITPPPIRISQPYRCEISNALCVPTGTSTKGIGVCQCAPGFAPTAEGQCIPSEAGHGWNLWGSAKPKSPPAIRTLQGNVQRIQKCNWKFQCPHVQECVAGRCLCPRGDNNVHEPNPLNANMVWDEDENVCVSLGGSYCHVMARLQQSKKPISFEGKQKEEASSLEAVLYDRYAESALNVRCAPGIQCIEERGGLGGLGVCSTSSAVVVSRTLIIIGFVIAVLL